MAFRWPLNNFTISQGFGGNAEYYRQYGQAGHNGIDLAAGYDEPVYAADDGTVAFEGWGQNHSWMGAPAGICILINHGGSYAGYAHLNQSIVNKGDRVTKGQLIGHVGATGAATGPHLHFEMLPLSPDFNNGYAGRINIMPYIEQEKLATDAEIHQAYREILERPDGADPDGLATYRNYTIDFVRADLLKSPEYRDKQAAKAAAALADAQAKAEEAKRAAERKKAEEAAAAAQAELDRLAAEKAAAEKAAETKAAQYEAIIRENNALLKQILAVVQEILSKLTGIFK